MMDFVKRNFVLVLGVSLPLLLILIFAFAKFFTQLVDPPTFKPVFILEASYANSGNFAFKVSDEGHLEVLFTGREMAENNLRQPWVSRVYIFDHASQTVESFPFSEPDSFVAGEQIELDVPEKLANLKIITGTEAPDGYRVVPFDYSRGSFFTQLFGYRNSYNTRYALEKDKRKFPITIRDNNFGELVVIGWVKLEAEDGP